MHCYNECTCTCVWYIYIVQKSSEKKKNWRRKHEDFLQSIRSARDYTEAQNAGTIYSNRVEYMYMNI